MNPSASRPPLKNIGQSHHGRLQRSLGSVSFTFAQPPGPRSPGRGWNSNPVGRTVSPPRLSGIGPADQNKRIVAESGKRRRSRIDNSPGKMVPKSRPMEPAGRAQLAGSGSRRLSRPRPNAPNSAGSASTLPAGMNEPSPKVVRCGGTDTLPGVADRARADVRRAGGRTLCT